MPPKAAANKSGKSGAGKAPVKAESVSQAPAPDAPMPETSTPVATPSGTSAPSKPASRPGSVRPSPAVRGRGGPKPQPKFAGRRSATQRAELEAAEAKKREAEAKAAVEDAKRKAKEDRKFGYGRGKGGPRGGRGRGGHMGDRPREYTSEAAGVFGGGRTVADVKGSRSSRPTYSGSGGGGGGGGVGTSLSGGRSGGSGYFGGSSIKREPGDRDIDMGGMRPRMSTEDGGYISSDEDEAEGAKRDIDRMQVIDLTGDNEAEVDDPFVPIRLGRVAHKERAVGLQAEESLDTSDGAEVISDKKKGKQRARDVQVTGTAAVPRRPTTYSSSDTEGDPQIKQEPTDEEHARPTTPEARDAQLGAADASPTHDPPSSPESKRKAKERIKANADAAGNADGNESDIEIPPEPHFQTQAEKDEWVRHYHDKQNIRHELGRLVPKDAPQPDAEGDTTMAEDTPHVTRARERQRLREEHVYLFQFPPVLPDLKAISVKDETEAARSNGDGGVAMDIDNESTDPISAATAKSATSKSNRPSLPSGQVGKLRVHKSGKTTLDWGGTRMVLSLGAEATFLQNVLIAKVPETKPKEGDKPPNEQEDAVGMGMGIIRAKFVCTPDWDEILK